MRGRNSLGTGGVVRPKKSLIWVEAMRRAMPLVKPMVTGRGNIFDGCPEAREAHDEEQDASHEADEREAGDAELCHNAGDDDNEGTGRAADLGARAAERGDEESGDDSGVEAGLRRDAGGDGEGHGQRQRDQTHRYTGNEVVRKLRWLCNRARH